MPESTIHLRALPDENGGLPQLPWVAWLDQSVGSVFGAAAGPCWAWVRIAENAARVMTPILVLRMHLINGERGVGAMAYTAALAD